MYSSTHPYLAPTQEGLALGGTIITKRRHDGTLAIAGREEETLALLSIGYRRPIGPEILRKLKAVSKAYSRTAPGDWPSLRDPGYDPPHAPDADANALSAKSRTLMHLALTGLNRAENMRDVAPRLAEARKKLDAGMEPLALLKAAGLLSRDWPHGETPSPNTTPTTPPPMANSQGREREKMMRRKQQPQTETVRSLHHNLEREKLYKNV